MNKIQRKAAEDYQRGEYIPHDVMEGYIKAHVDYASYIALHMAFLFIQDDQIKRDDQNKAQPAGR